MLLDASPRGLDVGRREHSTLGRLRLISAALKTCSRKYLLEFVVCSLFEERFRKSDHTGSNDTMIVNNEWGECGKKQSRPNFKLVSLYLPGENE
jgi:hypothetical protein